MRSGDETTYQIMRAVFHTHLIINLIINLITGGCKDPAKSYSPSSKRYSLGHFTLLNPIDSMASESNYLFANYIYSYTFYIDIDNMVYLTY